MPKKPKTLEGEFKAGMESGKFPNAQNTHKAIRACALKSTEPLIRAYWTGYLCQAHFKNPNFFA